MQRFLATPVSTIPSLKKLSYLSFCSCSLFSIHGTEARLILSLYLWGAQHFRSKFVQYHYHSFFVVRVFMCGKLFLFLSMLFSLRALVTWLYKDCFKPLSCRVMHGNAFFVLRRQQKRCNFLFLEVPRSHVGGHIVSFGRGRSDGAPNGFCIAFLSFFCCSRKQAKRRFQQLTTSRLRSSPEDFTGFQTRTLLSHAPTPSTSASIMTSFTSLSLPTLAHSTLGKYTYFARN